MADVVLGDGRAMSGIELIPALRKAEVRAPVVLVTAFADAQRLKAALKAGAGQGALATLIRGVGTVAVVAYGAWLVSWGRLTVGELLAFYALVAQLYAPIVRLTGFQSFHPSDQHFRVSAVDIHPRSVDVEISKCDIIETLHIVESAKQSFVKSLRCAVEGPIVIRVVILGRRKLFRHAIDRG